ncbi:acetyl esterase [Actinotalea subterranea]|uniref:acetyl esterase n=1 Tax=Actinotalea subterranea TaxID=2607497 RepID=UPI0011ED08CF|nr:acetyl esterase [Actinotalea subterranea]
MNPPEVLARVTTQMAAVLDKQAELADGAFATDVGFEEMRRRYALERSFWNDGGPTMAETVDGVVPGPYGDIRIRYHRPGEGGVRPCIVYVHGGGFVVGDLDTHSRIMRTLAARTGAVVVGVDYALSPEARFPRAVHECAAVARHLAAHADALGIDAANLSFAGDSGGANLSLAATLYLRDEVSDAPTIRCLLLYYGMYGLADSASRRLFGGEWDGLTKADLDYYMDCYTNDARDLASPYLDCLAADLSHGVPPCYVAASALDPLRDDSLALAEVLAGAGVPHRVRVFDGVLHGFLHHSRMLPEASEALEEGAEFHRHAIALTTR